MLRFVIEFAVTIALIGAIPELFRTIMDALCKCASFLNDLIRRVFRLDKEDRG